MDNLEQAIGSRLKERRKSLKMTIKDVVTLLSSHGINISEKTLYSWEGCHRQPDADTFVLLCKIYNIKDAIDYFITTKEVNKPLSIDNLSVTSLEQSHLKKYRALDERGKQTVDTVLESQYQIAMSQKESSLGIVDEERTKYNPTREEMHRFVDEQYDDLQKGTKSGTSSFTSSVEKSKIG